MIIENDEEHRLALAEIDRLSGRSRPGGVRPRWCTVLVRAVCDYEDKHFPLPQPTEAEAKAFRAAEGGPICKEKGHKPVEKMSAVICDRCGEVLEER